MLGNLGGVHLIVILAIVLLIFGAAKLPALARSVGQSVTIFKGEVKKEKADAAAADEEPVAHATVSPISRAEK